MSAGAVGTLGRASGTWVAAACLLPAAMAADPAPAAPPPVVPAGLAPPVEAGGWLRPAPGTAALPAWGIPGGLAVGLWPTPGPRGLFRIYAPYLGHRPGRMVNFVAVEPIVAGRRGLSELEPSRAQASGGKAMWAAEQVESDGVPQLPWFTVAGREDGDAGARRLSLFVHLERFDNGAEPVVEVSLCQDRPHEVAFRLWARPGSAPMQACVLTATMGNYARLRHLWLSHEVVDARRLWPQLRPDPWGFAPWAEWTTDRVLAQGPEAVLAVTPNEADPAQAAYAESVPAGWRYEGKVATQYWRTVVVPGLRARVNGRQAYWGGNSPIPGGVAYENVEFMAPFLPGQEFRFGVTPEPPEALGFDPACRDRLTDGR